jgi:Domain of unknown function (DUF4915)
VVDLRGRILLASCVADKTLHGGLYAFDGHELETLDSLSTMGLGLAGTRLLRVLRPRDDPDTVGQLVIYDDRGVEHYMRIDALNDAHDIAWDGSSYIAVSTSTNSILWISPSGDVIKTWKAAGDGDAWHLNNLCFKDGDLHVCAFGRFDTHRGWLERQEEPVGLVINLATGADVITGLVCPHNPRFFDGAWTVCNSYDFDLLQIDPASGQTVRRLRLDGWTRGLAVDDEYLFVGESADRNHVTPNSAASIAIVNRRTWQLIERVVLPVSQVYDLLLVSPSIVDGIRRGVRNLLFTSGVGQDQRDAASDDTVAEQALIESHPLGPDECDTHIEADVPPFARPGELLELQVLVENLGPTPLASAPPNPVHIAFRWLGAEGVVEGEHRLLPGAIGPLQTVALKLPVLVPRQGGEYTLRIALVQEGVRWFDEENPRNACSNLVWVGDPTSRSVSAPYGENMPAG